MYQVIDSTTGRVLGQYMTRERAQRRADRLDTVYGSLRYTVHYVAIV